MCQFQKPASIPNACIILPTTPSYFHLFKQRLTFQWAGLFHLQLFICSCQWAKIRKCVILFYQTFILDRWCKSLYECLPLFNYHKKHSHFATLQGQMTSESICLVFIIMSSITTSSTITWQTCLFVYVEMLNGFVRAQRLRVWKSNTAQPSRHSFALSICFSRLETNYWQKGVTLHVAVRYCAGY